MSFIRKIEELAASKLKKLFLDAQKYADSAVEDLAKAEKALMDAKIRAAEATERAHQAATEAAQKAQEAASQLLIEVKAAEERMLQHKEILEKSNK
jgi:hypothetical protein